MARPSWSCEHCGRDTRDAERPCDYCGSGMCERCTDKHDLDGVCPSTAPVGVPAASVRDTQLSLKTNKSSSDSTYPVGTKVEINLTPLGTCITATIADDVGDDPDVYVVQLYVRGERPHPKAVEGWEGFHVAVAQHVRQLGDAPAGSVDP